MRGTECTVVDLLTLNPLDRETILESRRHGKGPHRPRRHAHRRAGGEIAAIIAEHAFEYLDAPIRVWPALISPHPYHHAMEDFFCPRWKIAAAARELAAY